MKSQSKPKRPLRQAGASASVLFAATACAVFSSSPIASAATISWNSGTTGLVGDFNDATKWVGGVAPGVGSSSDIAKIDNGSTATALGASTVNFLTGYNVTLGTLDIAASNVSNNKPVFNHTGGLLTTGSLLLGHTAFGASKSPEYRISGGTLNITSSWAFGDGSAIKFLASGGVINYSGGAFIFGNNGVTHTVSLSNNATLNYNSSSQITIGGGAAAGAGVLSLANTASFNASTVLTILMGNDGTKGNTITLSDSATFSAPLATLVLGQFISGTPTATAGTVTLGGTSNLNVATLKTGGNNAGNLQWGIVVLNGGTLETGSVVAGASLTPADATHNVVRANGGTVKAKGASANFFAGVYLDLQVGGLSFDTNNNTVTITNPMTGVGGLTKKGLGTLTLSSNTLTYSGDTLVTGGVLSLPTASFPDTANVSIATGGKISLGAGLEDQVGTLTLGGVSMPNGVYGSSSSAAPLANQDDNFFSGTGTLRVGPPTAAPRSLVWEGVLGQNWVTNDVDKNFLDGATQTGFHVFDNVTFGDRPDPLQRTVTLTGAVQPTSVTVNNSIGNDYVIQGGGSIGGSTGIVKNGAGNLTLGGTNNVYTGLVTINAGKVTEGSGSAFGTSTGITIASGAQVDLNGQPASVIYSYTIAGTGPDGTAAIVNSGAMRQGDSGIKNLILSADASIGNNGSRFDFGQGGTLTGNGHTLTKVGTNDMGFRANASGTPVNIVAAGGTIWAESTGNAFGGATGTLTIKSGARAGTYGTLTIPTPVTIESGGTLHNQGLATGTWTGVFNVAGEFTLDSNGGPIAITGAITGTANLTKGGTGIVTITTPTYGGNTTVTSGQLTLSAASLGDTSTVTLTGPTSVLALTHGTSDVVGKLFLDGVQQAAGVYVSTTNAEAIPGAIPTSHIIGTTGSLTVTAGPATGPYADWANARITNPAYVGLKGPDDDPDGDGIKNYAEFLFGTDPQAGGGSLVTSTYDGNGLILTWCQRNDGATYEVQESTDLTVWSSISPPTLPDEDQTGVPTGYIRIQAYIFKDVPVKFARVAGTGS